MSYRVTCICGQPVRASSSPGEQIAHCPSCGRSIMLSGPKPGVKKKKFAAGTDLTWVLIGGAALAGIAAIGGVVWGLLLLMSYVNEQARSTYSGAPQQQAPPQQPSGPSLLPPDQPQRGDTLAPPPPAGVGAEDDLGPPPPRGNEFSSPVGDLGPPSGNP